nr:hypothetical protein [Tanacetum cinerariifolium]
MARLAFCDYNNMVAILKKYEHNVDFHQIVDFVEASHIRYALTINPTVYVFHIRQFWSTARIETIDEGTKILATVDGKPRTISESSIRRNLKLNDEAVPFHTRKVFTTLRVNSPSFLGRTVPLFDTMLVHQDEPASPLGDDSQGEDFLTVFGLEVEQNRENIIKTSTLPHDLTPRVTSFDADEGSQDKDGVGAEPFGEDTTIKGRSLETEEEAGIEKSTKRGSNDTKELVNVLTSVDAASILTSGVQVVSVPPAVEVATVSVPTSSGLVPTASPIFTTASVVTPYLRRKGKEKMVESNTPKKKKLQEQIDVQVAREMEEQMARVDQRRNKQIARDAEIARIHTEEELQLMIDGLDRNNEVIARNLHEYEQALAELTIGEKIELINELVKYQDHHSKILKYQAQQSKPLSKKQQSEFYMSKQIEDFVPVGSKEKEERFKRKGLRLERESTKKMKISEEVSHEDLEEMMQEDLTQLWTLVKETLSIRQATSDKEKELWVELKRLYEPDVKD